jgi:RND family efflux transporter MFP subunit
MSSPDLSALRIDERARRAPRRFGWRAIAIGLVVLLAVAAVLFVALREKPPEIEVAAARADKGGRAALLNASGYVTPRQRATIAAKITARVNEIYVDEGMQVEPGQVLARLDDSDARARLISAMAERAAIAATLGDLQVNLDNAERELKRVEELWDRKLVAEQSRDQAKMAVDSFKARIALAREQVGAAEARVKVAQQDLDNCTVRAPFGGIVVSKDAQRGEMVSPVSAGGGFTRTGIATVVDMDSREIEVDVNEAFINRVKANQKTEAVLDAYPDWVIPSHVINIVPTADRQKATVRVRIGFDTLEPRILPDMGVKVSFLEDRQVEGTQQAAAPRPSVRIPSAAVMKDGDTSFVWRVTDGAIERVAVRTGGERDGQVEVLSGINAGDVVVAAPVEGLSEGVKVKSKNG